MPGYAQPLSQVANVSVAGPGLLSVQVWDKSVVKAVEVAIRDSNLGLNPQAEGQVIRVPLPPLTQERRNELAKAAARYAEQTRVAVRGVRRDGMEQVKGWVKKHEFSEDEAKRQTIAGTRRFARKQLGWFRRDPRIVWLPAGPQSAITIASVVTDKVLGGPQEA